MTEHPNLDTVVGGSTPAERLTAFPTEVPITWVGVVGTPATVLAFEFIPQPEDIVYETGEPCPFTPGCLGGLHLGLEIRMETTDSALVGNVEGVLQDDNSSPVSRMGSEFTIKNLTAAFLEQDYVDLAGEPLEPEALELTIVFDSETDEFTQLEVVDAGAGVVLAEWIPA